jgi:tripartite ATP-independent transporter DctP family solute receptor
MKPLTGGTRRRFLRLGMGAPVALGLGSISRFAHSQQAEFQFKFGSELPAAHPSSVRAAEAARRVSEASNGRLVIEPFFGAALGSATDMLSQVRSGAIEMQYLAPANLSTVDPRASLHSVPFAFESYDKVWPALDGGVGEVLRNVYARVGLHALPKAWDHGYRQITTSSKPINTPSDLAGVKMRVAVVPLYVSLFKALGAATTAINFSELYTALQSRVVDGQENPLPLIDSARLYEVQKFCSRTSHTWEGYFVACNQRHWSRLPKNLQELVTNHFGQAAEQQRSDLTKLAQTLEQSLASKGMQFSHPDPAPFRAQLQKAGFYKEWAEKFGPEAWTTIERYAGKLA